MRNPFPLIMLVFIAISASSIRAEEPPNGGVESPALSPDGRSLAAVYGGRVYVIDLQTVHAWCLDISQSIKQRDFDKHMQLVSTKVKVYGMPSKGVIDFKEWRSRRKFEFENDSLMALNYQDIKLIGSSAKRLRFTASETMLGNDGKMVILNKHFILELEENGIWRVVEENVNDWRVKKLNLESY